MQNDDVSVRLRQKKIIVATHVYGTGASQDLVRYLNEHRTQKVLSIGHPLFYDTCLTGSGYEIYQDGRKVYEASSRNQKIPLFVGYAIHMAKSLVWVLRTGEQWDVYIGSNNLNAFTGLILRALGKVRKVVYYVIDFNPNRYESPLVNRLYQWLDQYCTRHCDETWNMSPRMQAGRKKYFGFTGGNQKVVPVGLWMAQCLSLPMSRIGRHTMAFVGHVQEKQGLQFVVRAIPRIVRKIPDFKLLVIGGGDYIPVLQALVRQLHVSAQVTFTGYIKDHVEIEKLLSTSAMGVALYDKYDGKKLSFSYFGNPTKVKTYLGAGLPVILTNVPYNARTLVDAGCGRIVTTDSKDITEVVTGMMKNPGILQKYRQNVISYRKKFDWNRIFDVSLSALI